MYYVTTDKSGAITAVYNSDGPFSIPPGAQKISQSAAMIMAAHPIGFGAFDFKNGAVQENTVRCDSALLPQVRYRVSRAIEEESIRRVRSAHPQLADIATLRAMQHMNDAVLDSAAVHAKAVYGHGKQLTTWAQSATTAELNAYNPATDPNWP